MKYFSIITLQICFLIWYAEILIEILREEKNSKGTLKRISKRIDDTAKKNKRRSGKGR